MAGAGAGESQMSECLNDSDSESSLGFGRFEGQALDPSIAHLLGNVPSPENVPLRRRRRQVRLEDQEISKDGVDGRGNRGQAHRMVVETVV